MLTQYTFSLNLDSPRLMPHAGSLQVTHIEVNIVCNSNEPPSIALSDDYSLIVNFDNVLTEAFLTSYVLVCEYHLNANYSVSYLHKLLVNDRQFYELLRTWHMKPGVFECIQKTPLCSLITMDCEDEEILNVSDLNRIQSIFAKENEAIKDMFLRAV